MKYVERQTEHDTCDEISYQAANEKGFARQLKNTIAGIAHDFVPAASLWRVVPKVEDDPSTTLWASQNWIDPSHWA